MLFKNSKKINVNYSLRTPDAELLFDEPKLIKTIHETKSGACCARTRFFNFYLVRSTRKNIMKQKLAHGG